MPNCLFRSNNLTFIESHQKSIKNIHKIISEKMFKMSIFKTSETITNNARQKVVATCAQASRSAPPHSPFFVSARLSLHLSARICPSWPDTPFASLLMLQSTSLGAYFCARIYHVFFFCFLGVLKQEFGIKLKYFYTIIKILYLSVVSVHANCLSIRYAMYSISTTQNCGIQ